jgi:hypothetical protein
VNVTPTAGTQYFPRFAAPDRPIRGNVEQTLSRREIEPAQKSILFVGCEPAALSNVIAKGIASNLSVQVSLKIAVVNIVMATGSWLGWNCFTHLDSPLERYG